MTIYPTPVSKTDYSNPALSIKKGIGTYYFINLKLIVIQCLSFILTHLRVRMAKLIDSNIYVSSIVSLFRACMFVKIVDLSPTEKV